MKITKLYDAISPDNVCTITLTKTALGVTSTQDGKTHTDEMTFATEDEALDAYYERLWATVGEGYNIEKEPISAATALFDDTSGKLCVLGVDGAALRTETTNKGKTKLTEKAFSSNQQAVKEYEKKVWAALKKGFIARNPEAKPGQALLHRFISVGYNGGLGFENTPLGIYVYAPVRDEGNDDALMLLDREGRLLNRVTLPPAIMATMRYHAPTHRLYLRSWHNIYRYDPQSDTLTPLLNSAGKPISFLAVSDNRIAYGSHPDWTLLNERGELIQQGSFDVEILSGSFPFCAALSKDGKTLAMSREEGQIELLDAETGQTQRIITGDFPTVAKMAFVDGDNTLVIQETHGKWRIRFFNVNDGSEMAFKGLVVPAYAKDTAGFCFNDDESLMVQYDGLWIYVFDYLRKKHLHTFRLEHCVKRGEVKFIDSETLGVRTDYGCFSLYRV